MTAETSGRRGTGTPPSLRHRGPIAAVAAVALVATWAVAARVQPPVWELDLTSWGNAAPDSVASMLSPVMQLGSLLAPLVAAAVLWWATGRRSYAAATALAGAMSWAGAKIIKEIIERGRPEAYLADIDVRASDGDGFGFVSGHSALAATTAVMVAAALPRRWRPLPAVLAGLVGLARIVVGVHLPADVIGGWAFGTLVGIGALTVHEQLGNTSDG